MKHWQTMLANLIEVRKPEEAAVHSFDDFHAVGLAYVNLLRTPELTAKLYFASAVMPHNADGYLVSPHDHAYRFHTFVVCGRMNNIVFDEVAADWGMPFHRFEFRSALNPSPGMTLAGPTRLTERSVETIAAGDGYYLAEDEIHTIQVTKSEPTILFLLQYADQRSSTRLYHRDPTPPSLAGLYKPMGAARVRYLLDMAHATLEA